MVSEFGGHWRDGCLGVLAIGERGCKVATVIVLVLVTGCDVAKMENNSLKL